MRINSLGLVRWSAIGIAVVIALGALCRVDKVVEVKPPEKIVGMENPTGVKIEPGGIPITVSLGTGWGATALLALLAAWRAWRLRKAAIRVVRGIGHGETTGAQIKEWLADHEDATEREINRLVRKLGYARGTKR